MLIGRNLVDPDDFSIEELDEIFALADEIIQNPDNFKNICDGKLLGSLFFEPSTRTRLSFESAMQRLGGRIVGFAEPGSSSTAKGESLLDTVKTVAGYTDIIVMRHPKEGSSGYVAPLCEVPFINAGDGGHQHPTQTLTDLMTIRVAKNTFDNLTIGFCGDLQFGRTVHSLIKAMSRYKNIKIVLISAEELQIAEYIKSEVLIQKNIEYKEVESLESVIGELDVLYMTRVQKERFVNVADYVRLKDNYILDMQKLSKAKEDLVVLHPMPRVNEISIDVDNDPRAWYFRQSKYGMIVRMALIAKLLGVR